MSTLPVSRLDALIASYDKNEIIYLSTAVLNSIDDFKLRIVNGKVVHFDTIHTNFTHKRPEEKVFRYHTAPFQGTLREYVEATTAAMAKQTTLFGGLGDIQNVVYCSCAPNLDATAIIPGWRMPTTPYRA